MNTTVWRWFPLGLFAAMAMVFAVNAYMVYDAVSTFPGAAGTDGFDLSNQYNHVLDTARQEATLGWRIEARTADQTPVLRLTDRDGAPLANAVIGAYAERPVGPPTVAPLTFHPVGDGYQADSALASGQWDLMLTLHAAGRQYTATRRVVVR